jgi:TatD DNase family protein
VVDTHCHLDTQEPAAFEQLDRARTAGVTRLGVVGTDHDSCDDAIDFARRVPEAYAIVGLHPHETAGFGRRERDWIEAYAHGRKVCAVGETGLDYYRDYAPRDDQRRAFEAHVEVARMLDMPLVIHTRAAEDDTFALLAERAGGLTVILHCFSAPGRLAECVERGYMCSFAGNVTYPKAAELQAAARKLPADLLLVETDSPFLSPQPVRGKPNEPANVTHTARFVAELRGVAYDELEWNVEQNSARVFAW